MCGQSIYIYIHWNSWILLLALKTKNAKKRKKEKSLHQSFLQVRATRPDWALWEKQATQWAQRHK